MEHGNGYATVVERSAVRPLRSGDLAHKPRGAHAHEIKTLCNARLGAVGLRLDHYAQGGRLAEALREAFLSDR